MKLFLETEPGVGHSGWLKFDVNEAKHVGPGCIRPSELCWADSHRLRLTKTLFQIEPELSTG